MKKYEKRSIPLQEEVLIASIVINTNFKDERFMIEHLFINISVHMQ